MPLNIQILIIFSEKSMSQKKKPTLIPSVQNNIGFFSCNEADIIFLLILEKKNVFVVLSNASPVDLLIDKGNFTTAPVLRSICRIL